MQPDPTWLSRMSPYRQKVRHNPGLSAEWRGSGDSWLDPTTLSRIRTAVLQAPGTGTERPRHCAHGTCLVSGWRRICLSAAVSVTPPIVSADGAVICARAGRPGRQFARSIGDGSCGRAAPGSARNARRPQLCRGRSRPGGTGGRRRAAARYGSARSHGRCVPRPAPPADDSVRATP